MGLLPLRPSRVADRRIRSKLAGRSALPLCRRFSASLAPAFTPTGWLGPVPTPTPSELGVPALRQTPGLQPHRRDVGSRTDPRLTPRNWKPPATSETRPPCRGAAIVAETPPRPGGRLGPGRGRLVSWSVSPVELPFGGYPPTSEGQPSNAPERWSSSLRRRKCTGWLRSLSPGVLEHCKEVLTANLTLS